MRREHNNRMTQAYWSAVIPYAKKPITLKSLLVEEDPQPRRRKSWQEIKAAIVLAIGGPPVQPEEPKEP